jgi:hypothetical protein
LAVKKSTIIDSWPALKKDLLDFLSDTDAWVIAALKEARAARDWDRVDKLIAIMDMVHTMSHGH